MHSMNRDLHVHSTISRRTCKNFPLTAWARPCVVILAEHAGLAVYAHLQEVLGTQAFGPGRVLLDGQRQVAQVGHLHQGLHHYEASGPRGQGPSRLGAYLEYSAKPALACFTTSRMYVEAKGSGPVSSACERP